MIERIKQRLLEVSVVALAGAFWLLAIVMIVIQAREGAGGREILPLAAVVTMLSLSGLAFNWCRVPTTLASAALLKRVYKAAVDLFVAAMLALVSLASTFALQAQNDLGDLVSGIALVVHWLFFLPALLLFVIAMCSLIMGAKSTDA